MVPAVVLFSILLGIALIGIERKGALLDVLGVAGQALSGVARLVARLTPYGLFAIAATTAGTLSFEQLGRLEVYLVTYVLVALLVSLWVLPGLVATLTPIRVPEIFGLTRNSGAAEIARAALESVGYQTRDLLEAMRADWPASPASETVLRVDGGMTASDQCMQFLADILACPVDRPTVLETTALGAAYLAGRTAGICPDLAGFAAQWRLDRRFEPLMDASERERKYAGWKQAVRRTLTAAN